MPGTIGYTTAGSNAVTTQSFFTNDGHHPGVTALTYTAVADDVVTDIAVYGSSAGGGNIQVAVYATSGSTIGAMVGSPVTVNLTSTVGWHHTAASIPLTAGTVYTVCYDFWTGVATVLYRQQSLSGTRRSQAAGTSLPNPWVESGTTPGESFSIYATVEEVAPAGGWSGAITLLFNHASSSGGANPSVTSASFTPPANSLEFVQHSHSAVSHATVPDVQISNTGGLTFARYVTAVGEFSGTNDIQGALFVAPVGGSPSSMTVTVDPFPTANDAYQSMLGYAVTEGEILQGPVGRIVVDGATTHTTAALPVATTAGNLVIAGFSTHTTGGTVPSAPSGFTLLASTGTNYQMNTVFYSTTHVGTTVTCPDLGESLYVSASWIMEIETPAPSGPQSVRFNAFDDHYSRAATGLESSDFTMACWAYLSADRNTANFFLGADASSNWHSVGVHSDGTELYWSSTSGNTRTGAQLAVGAWYYVAIVYSASGTDTIYWGADGAALSSDSTTTSGVMSGITSGFTFHIGNTRDSEWWNGRIAQVKVWTAALSQAEIEAERDLDGVARTANLWAYYSFRDGPQTNDESGNGRTLTAAGTSLPRQVHLLRQKKKKKAAASSSVPLLCQRSSSG